ncbi:MAG: hypothetical protein ACKOA9_00945 [Actinomycetota bacterium]
MIRKLGVFVAAAALATVAVGSVSAGSALTDTAEGTKISVVNVGNATRGSTIRISCVVTYHAPPGRPEVATTTADLNFDASGRPSTKSGPLSEYFSAVGDSWVSEGIAPAPPEGAPPTPYSRTTCSHAEVDNGGATSTTWACSTVGVPSTPAEAGCAAASGTGSNPVVLRWTIPSDKVSSLTAFMVFTNTYPATPVEVTPLVTG